MKEVSSNNESMFFAVELGKLLDIDIYKATKTAQVAIIEKIKNQAVVISQVDAGSVNGKIIFQNRKSVAAFFQIKETEHAGRRFYLLLIDNDSVSASFRDSDENFGSVTAHKIIIEVPIGFQCRPNFIWKNLTYSYLLCRNA